MTPLLGICSGCGARCKTAKGSTHGVNSRGAAIAAVAIAGRQLAYVVEGIDPGTKQPTARLICRECVCAATNRTAA